MLLIDAAHAGGTAEDYADAERVLSWNYTKVAFEFRVEPHLAGKHRALLVSERRAWGLLIPGGRPAARHPLARLGIEPPTGYVIKPPPFASNPVRRLGSV